MLKENIYILIYTLKRNILCIKMEELQKNKVRIILDIPESLNREIVNLARLNYLTKTSFIITTLAKIVKEEKENANRTDERLPRLFRENTIFSK